MSKLSTKGRKMVASKNFASPKGTGDNKRKDSYPIHDKNHAVQALRMVSQHGSAAEKKRVRKKVRSRYPGIAK